MKCAFKYGLLGLLLMATIFCQAEELTGPNGPVKGIFYQPWQADLSLTRSDWERRMTRLHEDGLDTLYLQWLQYGEMNFLNAQITKDGPFIQVLLDAASHQGIGIFIGLYSDPGFFNALKLTTGALEGYLLHLREKSLKKAGEFQVRYGAHPAFRGWYISEEIDDLNWQSTPRRRILRKHLHQMGMGLRSLGHEKPIAFSTFFSGALSPEAFSEFCRQLLEKPDDFILVQDGLGGRMDIATTRRYNDSLKGTTEKQNQLCWIVELFNDELPGSAFRGKAIEPGELSERLAIVHKNFHGKRLTLFSLRYWLDKDARLSRHYRQHFFDPAYKKTVKAPR